MYQGGYIVKCRRSRKQKAKKKKLEPAIQRVLRNRYQKSKGRHAPECFTLCVYRS
jgi:hypothetical protein